MQPKYMYHNITRGIFAYHEWSQSHIIEDVSLQLHHVLLINNNDDTYLTSHVIRHDST